MRQGPRIAASVDRPQRTLECSMKRRPAATASIRVLFRIACLSLIVLWIGSGIAAYAESAKSFYKLGEAAEARDDYDTAFMNYQKAFTMVPKDMVYKEAYFRVRTAASAGHQLKGRKLFETGDEQGALIELLRATEIDPTNEAAQQEIDQIRSLHQEQPAENPTGIPEPGGNPADVDTIAAPVQLQPMSNEPMTLHMVQDSKVIYQAVGKAAGINVLFDPDYTGKRIQVDLNNGLAARRAAHCRHVVQHLLAAGHREHDFCRGQHPHQTRVSWKSRRCRPFI